MLVLVALALLFDVRPPVLRALRAVCCLEETGEVSGETERRSRRRWRWEGRNEDEDEEDP